MSKRTMLIGVLCFSLVVLLAPQAMAWSLKSGGWGGGTYHAWFDIAGGQKPGTTTTFFGTGIEVIDACLVCLNPGTNRQDVRVGLGGITFQLWNTQFDLQFDNRGRYLLETELPSSVQDLVTDEELCLKWTPTEGTCDPQATFEHVFDVSNADCRNDGWLPSEYLVKSLYLTGKVVTDCATGPTSPECNLADELKLYCETQQECRAGWDNVLYICVERGAPIAWDDYYSVRAGRTLTVKAPGVLGNDTDREGGPLTAVLFFNEFGVSGPLNGSLGTGGLKADGSFTYTPFPGYTGNDSFTYQAKDPDGHLSNVATVHITVQ